MEFLRVMNVSLNFSKVTIAKHTSYLNVVGPFLTPGHFTVLRAVVQQLVDDKQGRFENVVQRCGFHLAVILLAKSLDETVHEQNGHL